MAGNVDMGELKKEYRATFTVNLAQLIALVAQVIALAWFTSSLSHKVDTTATNLGEVRDEVKSLSNNQLIFVRELSELKGAVNALDRRKP